MSCAAPAVRWATSTAPSATLLVSPPPTTAVTWSTRRRSSIGAPAPTARPNAPLNDSSVRKEIDERRPGQRREQPVQRAGRGSEVGGWLSGRARLRARARYREREPANRRADPEDGRPSAHEPRLVAQPARPLRLARPLL